MRVEKSCKKVRNHPNKNKTFSVTVLRNNDEMVKYIFDVWERKSSSWAGRAMPTISWLVRFGCVTFFRRYSFFKLFFFIFSVWPSFRKDTRNYLYIVLKLILFFFISLIQLSRYISKVIVTETSCHRMVDQITMKFEICIDNTNRLDCRGGFSKKEGVSSERGGWATNWKIIRSCEGSFKRIQIAHLKNTPYKL